MSFQNSKYSQGYFSTNLYHIDMETEAQIHRELFPRMEHQLLPNPGPKAGSSNTLYSLLIKGASEHPEGRAYDGNQSTNPQEYTKRTWSKGQGWVTERRMEDIKQPISSSSSSFPLFTFSPAHIMRENLSITPCTSLIMLNSHHASNYLVFPLLFMCPGCRGREYGRGREAKKY